MYAPDIPLHPYDKENVEKNIVMSRALGKHFKTSRQRSHITGEVEENIR